MGVITHQSEPESTKEGLDKARAEADRRAEARKRRVATVRRVAGIWSSRADIPADGIEYERELRNNDGSAIQKNG